MTTVTNSTGTLVAQEGESFAVNLTAASIYTVKTGDATLNGIVVASHSSGKVEFRDGTGYTGSSVVVGTITLGATERYIPFYGARFASGLVVHTTGTIDATVFYK